MRDFIKARHLAHRTLVPRATRASAQSGVSSDGLMTAVQPAASAAPALRVIMAMGKFHGVTSEQTPTGWCITMMRWLGDAAGRMSPSMRLASSENHDRNDEP